MVDTRIINTSTLEWDEIVENVWGCGEWRIFHKQQTRVYYLCPFPDKQVIGPFRTLHIAQTVAQAHYEHQQNKVRTA